MKKKILYIITKSSFYGAQKYIYELANEFRNKNYDVVVAFGGTGLKNAPVGKLETLLKDRDIPTRQVLHFMRDVSLFGDTQAVFELMSLIKAEKPNILHVTSSKAGALGALAGRLMRTKKIIFTAHGLPDDESWRPWWQRFLILLTTWITILLSHKSIMISETTYQRAQNFFFCKKKVFLVRNGLRKQTLLNKEESKKILGLSELPQETLVLGTIAELHPNKNLETIFRALSKINGGPPVHFAIIGEGESKRRLQGV